MDWIMRILWALGMAVLAWLICIFFGGFLATVGQPQMEYVGSFLNRMATIVAVVVFILAFVGGAPAPLVAYFQRRPAAPR